jgi:hypothetical protein
MVTRQQHSNRNLGIADDTPGIDCNVLIVTPFRRDGTSAALGRCQNAVVSIDCRDIGESAGYELVGFIVGTVRRGFAVQFEQDRCVLGEFSEVEG